MTEEQMNTLTVSKFVRGKLVGKTVYHDMPPIKAAEMIAGFLDCDEGEIRMIASALDSAQPWSIIVDDDGFQTMAEYSGTGTTQ